jgi:hypothetical protein
MQGFSHAFPIVQLLSIFSAQLQLVWAVRSLHLVWTVFVILRNRHWSKGNANRGQVALQIGKISDNYRVTLLIMWIVRVIL